MKKIIPFPSIFKKEIEIEAFGHKFKSFEGTLFFSQLPLYLQEKVLESYIIRRERTSFLYFESEYLDEFIEKFELQLVLENYIKEKIKEMRIEEDKGNDYGYPYFTPEGECLGDFDENTLEPEEGLLFSSLSPEVQEIIINDMVEHFYDNDFDDDFFYTFLEKIKKYQEYQEFIRKQYLEELILDNNEGRALILSDNEKLEILKNLNTEELNQKPRQLEIADFYQQ